MNTRKGKAKFKKSRSIFNSSCSYMVVMVRIVEKLHPDKYYEMQWHTQAGNITTNLKVNIDFTLPALSTTNVMTWKYHVGDSAKGRYYMILGRDLLTELVLNLKFYDRVIESDDRSFKGYTTPMVYLGMYEFKILNTGEITPEESFTNAYVDEVYDLEHVCTSTKLLRVILDAKYDKEDLRKFMETWCQHLIITQRNKLLKLLQIFN